MSHYPDRRHRHPSTPKKKKRNHPRTSTPLVLLHVILHCHGDLRSPPASRAPSEKNKFIITLLPASFCKFISRSLPPVYNNVCNSIIALDMIIDVKPVFGLSPLCGPQVSVSPWLAREGSVFASLSLSRARPLSPAAL